MKAKARKNKRGVVASSSTASSDDNGVPATMRLAIFDLDYTIWKPEMYQLHGPPKMTPAPKNLSEKLMKLMMTNEPGMVLQDRNGDRMQLFDGASHALSEINRWREEGEEGDNSCQAAVASKTDEPHWARMCMKHMVVYDGSTLNECIPERYVEISYGSKVKHIERLHHKTGIAYRDMCFFDNEYWNIQDVSRGLPDVKCFYTPDGMTRKAWDDAKAAFGIKNRHVLHDTQLFNLRKKQREPMRKNRMIKRKREEQKREEQKSEEQKSEEQKREEQKREREGDQFCTTCPTIEYEFMFRLARGSQESNKKEIKTLIFLSKCLISSYG